MSKVMYLREEPGVVPSHVGTAGRLIYAIGDVHGRYDLLKALLAQIAEDSRRQPHTEKPLLIFCGDYIDRGSQSAAVVEAVHWLMQRPEFEVRALKGNHEEALLRFLRDPESGRGWLRFGGGATLMSYGVAPPRHDEGAEALVRARDALAERLPADHLALLQSLELMVVVGAYAFVHAGVRPGVPLDEQEEADLLWIRDDFLDSHGPYERVIVHGHSWPSPGQLLPHRLGIDTGAYETGVLSAVRLEGETVRLLDTADARAVSAA